RWRSRLDHPGRDPRELAAATCARCPYTTLFRSNHFSKMAMATHAVKDAEKQAAAKSKAGYWLGRALKQTGRAGEAKTLFKAAVRSEEHTSELQSRENLVCRLLLEKKKIIRHLHQ